RRVTGGDAQRLADQQARRDDGNQDGQQVLEGCQQGNQGSRAIVGTVDQVCRRCRGCGGFGNGKRCSGKGAHDGGRGAKERDFTGPGKEAFGPAAPVVPVGEQDSGPVRWKSAGIGPVIPVDVVANLSPQQI